MTAALSHHSQARFELATAETWANPWPMYQALRDKDPVHHVVPEDRPGQDYWVLSREGLSSRDVGQFRLKFRGMNYVEGTDYRFVPTKK